MPRETHPRHFFVALESLRGIAAMGVLLFHIAWTYPLHDSLLIRNGWRMVDLFFVLSGFVISHAYSATIDSWQAIGKFMWLRLGRLYPLHLTMLVIFLGIELARYAAEIQFGLIANKRAFSSNTTSSFMSNLLLIQALGLHDKPTYNFPAWSISTEFCAYLVFSVVSLFFKTRWALISAATIIIAISFSLESPKFELIVLRCITGFFVGTIAYQIYNLLIDRPFVAKSNLMSEAPAFLSLAVTIFLLTCPPTSETRAAILIAFACLIISIAANAGGPLSRLLTTTPLAHLGKLSYSIYMTHSAVIWAFSQVLRIIMNVPQVLDEQGDPLLTPGPGIGLFFLGMTILCVLVLSHYTYMFIEDPFRRRSRMAAEHWFR